MGIWKPHGGLFYRRVKSNQFRVVLLKAGYETRASGYRRLGSNCRVARRNEDRLEHMVSDHYPLVQALDIVSDERKAGLDGEHLLLGQREIANRGF